MVTIILNKNKLLNKLGIDGNLLENILFNLKSEMKMLDENNLEIEINADRLDLLSSDGISRAVKGLLERELGEAKYKVVDTDFKLIIHNVRSRPYALAAVVYNANIDLQELIQFQEKLHSTIGRKRKKVAIGIHDLNKIDTKIIEYKEIPTTYKFIPLNGNREMTIDEVIYQTEQGKLYGKLSIFDNLSPSIIQSDGQVLSIPPIINSEKSKIDERTKNFFIDVTGTSFDAVAQTLDLLVTNLAESGGTIGKVKIEYENKRVSNVDYSPLLVHKTISVNKNYIYNTLGIDKDKEKDICKHIMRMRMDCEEYSANIKVIVPPYRIDIINSIDIVEDVAMSIGYNNLIPSKYLISNYGNYDYITLLERRIRELSIGANFIEIFNFVLIKESKLFDKKYIKILNPISEEYNAVRNSLIPVLLDFLSKNQHAKFPVRVFEIGDVVIKDNTTDTGYRNDKRVTYAIMDSRVSYEDIQAPIHYILSSMGITPNYIETNSDIFIEGRVANVLYKNQAIGILGEIKPEILLKFDIEYPIVMAELYVTKIMELIRV